MGRWVAMAMSFSVILLLDNRLTVETRRPRGITVCFLQDAASLPESEPDPQVATDEIPLDDPPPLPGSRSRSSGSPPRIRSYSGGEAAAPTIDMAALAPTVAATTFMVKYATRTPTGVSLFGGGGAVLGAFVGNIVSIVWQHRKPY
jgi:hypothetical protein